MIGARNSCTEKGAADPLAATLLIGPRTAVTPVSVRARGGGGEGKGWKCRLLLLLPPCCSSDGRAGCSWSRARNRGQVGGSADSTKSRALRLLRRAFFSKLQPRPRPCLSLSLSLSLFPSLLFLALPPSPSFSLALVPTFPAGYGRAGPAREWGPDHYLNCRARAHRARSLSRGSEAARQ